MMKKKEPKLQRVELAKVPIHYQGLDCYCAIDYSDVKKLEGKNFIEAVVPMEGRSLEANSLWAVWYNQISKSLEEETPASIKSFCKLHYGVPILRAENIEFRRFYNAALLNLDYQQKLKSMDFVPVTSLLNKDQGSRYQKTLQDEYAQRGVILNIL